MIKIKTQVVKDLSKIIGYEGKVFVSLKWTDKARESISVLTHTEVFKSNNPLFLVLPHTTEG